MIFFIHKIFKRIVLIAGIFLCLLGCRKEVDVPLNVDFEYSVIDSNYNIPARISFSNKTSGALFYKWTFPDGDPGESNYKNPGYITFNKPGPVTIKLEAWNDYERSEKTIQIILDTVPEADFSALPRVNNISPVDWDFNFTGRGASRFKWNFENGSILTSTERNPPPVRYTIPGTYRVLLEIFNERNRTDSISKLIVIRLPLSVSFDIMPSFEDDDFEVPFTAKLDNHTTSAVTHQWSVTGNNGTINSPTDSIPTLQINTPGTYTITYTAGNGKQTETVSKSITVYPNSRLRSFQNIRLGINSAQASTGSFFSTYLRKVISRDDVNSSNGPLIDICYFGLSSGFTFNKFISPTEADQWTFQPIPGAQPSIIINKQESCGCGTNVTPAQFDAISSGSFFDAVPVVQTVPGMMEFDNSLLPRVVLFKNAAGKKGAIKITGFVADNVNSYIICDIKIQKD